MTQLTLPRPASPSRPSSRERLDRSRAYGEVHGESGLQAYAQRALTSKAGLRCARRPDEEAALSVAQRDALAKRRARRAAEIAASPAEAENAPIDEEVVEEEHEHAQEDDEFNALMFLTREISYPALSWTVLKKRYFVNKPSIQAAALYLVEEKKILPRAQVHPSMPAAAGPGLIALVQIVKAQWRGEIFSAQLIKQRADGSLLMRARAGPRFRSGTKIIVQPSELLSPLKSNPSKG